MDINRKGIDLIKKYEGFRSKPYLCPAKIPTIGYGATYYPGGKRVKLTDPAITEREAEKLLLEHLKEYVRAVDRYTTDKVNENQFSALVSFAYNLGISALQKSTLLRKVNNNPNDTTIKREFMRWVNAGGRRLQGLVKRRAEEAQLYFS